MDNNDDFPKKRKKSRSKSPIKKTGNKDGKKSKSPKAKKDAVNVLDKQDLDMLSLIKNHKFKDVIQYLEKGYKLSLVELQ
jgi:hypothetical protein